LFASAEEGRELDEGGEEEEVEGVGEEGEAEAGTSVVFFFFFFFFFVCSSMSVLQNGQLLLVRSHWSTHLWWK